MMLRPGRNVWRLERAHRTAVILDAAAYFGAVRTRCSKPSAAPSSSAGTSIANTRLVGAAAAPTTAIPRRLPIFCRAGRQRPRLKSRMLLWDFAMLYATERDLFPRPILSLEYAAPCPLCLDDARAVRLLAASETGRDRRRLAFTGGLDITIRRWDTSEHKPTIPLASTRAAALSAVPRRADAGGRAAARALARSGAGALACVARETRPAGCAAGDRVAANMSPPISPTSRSASPAPSRASKTSRRCARSSAVPRRIAAAERSIYIENQFLSCVRRRQGAGRAHARTSRAGSSDCLAATHASWIEAQHHAERAHPFHADAARGRRRRARAADLSPKVSGRGGSVNTMVHSKVMIVDDRLLHIGSANLNNRSMGTDTECDIAIAAKTEHERAAIRARARPTDRRPLRRRRQGGRRGAGGRRLP